MRRGEIRLVNLEPVVGSEATKLRPCVIVSNNNANATVERLGRGVLTVVPVTSNTGTIFPFQAELPADETGLNVDSKAQAEQIWSVDVRRIRNQIGFVPLSRMSAIDDALRIHLQL